MSDCETVLSAKNSPLLTPNNSPVSSHASDAAITTTSIAPLELPPSPVADMNDSDKCSVDHSEQAVVAEEIKQEVLIAEAIDAVKDIVEDSVVIVKEPAGCVPKIKKISKILPKIASLMKGLVTLIKCIKLRK